MWGKLRHGHWQQEGLGRVKFSSCPCMGYRESFPLDLTSVLSRHPPNIAQGMVRMSVQHQTPPNSPLLPTVLVIGTMVPFRGKPKV